MNLSYLNGTEQSTTTVSTMIRMELGRGARTLWSLITEAISILLLRVQCISFPQKVHILFLNSFGLISLHLYLMQISIYWREEGRPPGQRSEESLPTI